MTQAEIIPASKQDDINANISNTATTIALFPQGYSLTKEDLQLLLNNKAKLYFQQHTDEKTGTPHLVCAGLVLKNGTTASLTLIHPKIKY